ncbi:hypothetical protein OQA88_7154 [Cercophora sp. LCS_1]
MKTPKLFALAALLIPSAQALWWGGGLTILSKNLLDGAANNGSGAILVQQPAPYSAAAVSCTLLGETPWNPDKVDFNDTLSSALAYQVYQGLATRDKIYWVSKTDPDADTCRGVDSTGKIYDLDCLSEIPMLCTQSAPVSTRAFSNNSVHWQLNHVVGNKQLTGYRDYHTFKFRGVRFANKPERFTYSKAASFEDEGEVDATEAGADCSQPVGEVRNGSSEDCLFANIWTPYLPSFGDGKAKVRKNLKPVMLYLYGGGFTSGSGKNGNTDGTNLASRGDVVVVSVNYRVGNIGFLNLGDGVHNGNYAVSDMVSALEWVNRYIEYFGGDPNKVTLFGESAGAMGTHIILGVAKAQGLFHRAIMMSSPDGSPGPGDITRYMSYDTLEHNYETTTRNVLRDAGCLNRTGPLECLSKLSGFELVNLPTNANGVVIDGTYLTDRELVVNQTTLAANVSVMVGVTRDEAGIHLAEDAYPTPNDTLASYFEANIARQSNMADNASAILGLDRPHNISLFSGVQLPTDLSNTTRLLTPAQILNTTIRITTDAVFTCHGLAKSYSAAKHAAWASTYFFSFNRTYQTNGYTRPWCTPQKTEARPNGDPDAEYMKCHAGEQIIVFGTALWAGYPDRDGFDVPFMQLVVDYWAAFARAGDPNPEQEWLQARGDSHAHTLEQMDKTGRWEQVDPKKPTMRVLQWNGAQVPFPEGDVCAALGAPLDVFEKNQ